MSYDPISQDPVTVDPEYPAKMLEVRFDSHGAKLNGVMYVPPGAGPHPTIVLLHGFPGYERNFDLAQIFRRAGYNVMVFHYRGAWGSEGDFTFTHVLEDTEAAMIFLCDAETLQAYNIDSDNITVIGHSVGGWAALHMAGKGLVKRAGSLAGVNLALWGEMVADSEEARSYSLDFFESSLAPLSGVSAAYLIDEVVQHMDKFDVMRLVDALVDVELLLVAGERDEVVPLPLHHTPLVNALEQKDANGLTNTILDADHGFNDKRIALAQFIMNWLED